MHKTFAFLALGLIFTTSPSNAAPEGMKLFPSPPRTLLHPFGAGEKVVDYAIAADGSSILSLTNDDRPGSWLTVVSLTETDVRQQTRGRIAESALAVVSHPETPGVWFVLVRSGEGGPWKILRFAESNQKLADPTPIYTSTKPVRRLIISSRPFTRSDSEVGYRVVFAERAKDRWQMKSVTEKGSRVVDLSYSIAPKSPLICPSGLPPTDGWNQDCAEVPSTIHAPVGALPLSFHPMGEHFSYEDEKGCARIAYFDTQWNSGEEGKNKSGKTCEKAHFFHPNGSLSWFWSKEKKGIQLIDDISGASTAPRTLFPGASFTMPPVFFPDGRAIAAVERTGKQDTLSVLPVDDFRSGISNLWRFRLLNDSQLNGLEKYGGIFIQNPDHSYFHSIYDAHRYAHPIEPTIVTTDPFWYTLSLAMEAGFVLMEKEGAIPRYRRFLKAASTELAMSKNASSKDKNWLEILNVASALLEQKEPVGASHEDYTRCLAATTPGDSRLLRKNFDFTLCKARSHYEDDTELASYWRSFRYLTLGTSWDANLGSPLSESVLAEFPRFSPEVFTYASAWFDSYTQWTAPSTFRSIRETSPDKRWEVIHPFRKCGLNTKRVTALHSLFPVGWGWDDEITCKISDTNERNTRLEEWMGGFSGDEGYAKLTSSAGPNNIPKDLAESSSQYFKTFAKETSIYSLYLSGLHEDLLSSHPGGILKHVSDAFLRARSAVSAVGGWTHLKHTLQLVSEEPSNAEGGQGGPDIFEQLIADNPPGAVEPRPDVFLAQKRVVDEVVRLATTFLNRDHDFLKKTREISARLEVFAKAADIQKKSQPLDLSTLKEVEEFGGFLDHADLFFHTIMNKDYGIARSVDWSMSMAILASVGNYTKEGKKKNQYVATGKPFDTYLIVDQDGKRRIVAGASFSAYSFEDERMISDKEWRKNELPKAKLPLWLQTQVFNGK